MDKALLDTDIFSDIHRGKNPVVAARAGEYLARFGREESLQGFLADAPTMELLTLDLKSAEPVLHAFGPAA